ncbi:MAG: hypothetical protein HQL18_03530 [Candidatus Omnitrophica bacterium]|nr:hypothetical protein [Candidatus Omnitrophota bacterium]
MRKWMVLVLGLVMALGAATLSFAEDVFVTKNGKVYHHAESPFIKNRETVKMTKEEAEAKGYKPSRSYLKAKAAEKAKEAKEAKVDEVAKNN